MHFAPSHRLNLGLALALVGGAALALGGNAALTTRATTTQQQTQPVVAAVVSSPTATTTSTTAPATGTPSVASTQGPVTWAQAATLAARQTHATVDKVEATTGPSGTEYAVKLVRPDGSEIDVTVLGQTGRVVAASAQESLDAQQQNTPDVIQGADPVN
jgi:dTDP-4-dehydrorhamnose reductase